MVRRIAVYGATDDALALLPLLTAHPDLDVVAVFDPQAAVHRRRLALLDAPLAAALQRLLTDDPHALEDDAALEAVVDAGIEPPFATRFPALVARGVEILTPLAARHSWGSPAPDADADPKRELLQALEEIAAAVELVAAPDALATRLLEVSIAVTGAAGGSLLLRDADDEVLVVRAAVGLEAELWPKARVRLGEGVAGRVWAEGRAIAIHGRANPELFAITRERFDVAAALCVPLWHGGSVLGVLNLHHPTRGDLFGEAEVAFGEELGALVARIAAHGEEGLALRRRALRAEIAAEVTRILGERAPLEVRLAALCRHAASRAGRGVATLWWSEAASTRDGVPSLRLAASSLAGGALGAAARLAPGEGVDGRVASDREPVFLRRGDRLDYAALPLLAGPNLLGVLAVQPGADAPERGDEADALREIAGAAAALLDRELRAERAEARATRGEAVHEATLRLFAEADPDRIAESVASSAALILDAEHAIVRTLDEGSRAFRVRCHVGATSGPLDDALVELDRRAAREALRARAPIDSAEGDDDHAFLAAPLVHGGRALGTLAVYDKRGSGGPHFDALDREALSRLAAVASRALAAALPGTTPRAVEAGSERLVPFAVFAQRIDEELARAAAAGLDAGAFALVTCRIENQDELPAELAARAARNTASAFTAQLRSFDVATRTAPGALCALLPVPGAAPSEHVARLARAVAEAVAKDDADAGRVALVFGYALGDAGEASRAELLARASEPRIRML
jgi:signal transduction protein with GAF and PtsI domain